MERPQDHGIEADTLLLVGFANTGEAERRVAGLSAAGRWAAAARAAGGCDPVFVLGQMREWCPAALDDFRRVGLHLPPVQIAAAEPIPVEQLPRPVLLADGRYIPDAPALAGLLATPGSAVTLAGKSVATSVPAPLPGAALVVPVTDLARPAAAVRRLVRATAKPSDGIVSRRFNRPISQRISASLLLHVPSVRPSHATFAVAVVAALMVAAFLFGGGPGLIAGGVLFQVASVLDGVDGEIARASYRSSIAGAVLDTRVDIATNLGFFVGVSVSLMRLYGARQAVVGGVVVTFGVVGTLLLGLLARRAGRPGNFDVLKFYYRARFPTGWQRTITDVLVAMTSRDFFAFGFGLIIVTGGGWTVSWLLAGFSATWLAAIGGAFVPLMRRGDVTPAVVEALAAIH